MDYHTTDGDVLMPATQLLCVGHYTGQIIRAGEIIDEFEFPNLVTNEGLNHLLATELVGGTQITTWYLGVFEANYTPVAGVTAATITAASTESIAYAAATRVAFTPAAVAAQSTTNSASRASFIFKYPVAASSTSSRPERIPLIVGRTSTSGTRPMRWSCRPSAWRTSRPEKRNLRPPGSMADVTSPFAPAVGLPMKVVPAYASKMSPLCSD